MIKLRLGKHTPVVLAGLFLFCFVIAFVSGTMFLSLGDSRAESSEYVDITVNVHSVIAITTNAVNDELLLDIMPTPSGTLAKNDLVVTVSTNNITGYALSINSKTTDTSLVHEAASSTFISSASHAYNAPATLGADTWGWNLGTAAATTTFAKIPPSDDSYTVKTTNEPSSNSNTTVTFAANVTDAMMAGNYMNTIVFTATSNFVPPVPDEKFTFTIDTRMTNTLDTDPDHFSGTATEFYIPTNGCVGGASDWYVWPSCDVNHAYDWMIDWGDDSTTVVDGTSGLDSDGIYHNYAVPGEYRISIMPNGPAADGWMNAFGFCSDRSTPSGCTSDNLNMFKAINSPFSNLMRSSGSSNRFAFIFNWARNATGLPANLFRYIDTSGSTDVSGMFRSTFYYYAENATSATLPYSLFGSIDTSSATDVSYMFAETFVGYGFWTPSAAIPAQLFRSIDTSSAVNMRGLFYFTFQDYMCMATSGTIPANLFDSITTASATNVDQMFWGTFETYAMLSTDGAIPANLFKSINIANVDSAKSLFDSTFNIYAERSTVGTIPAGLFSSIDTSKVSDMSFMFRRTFGYYAQDNISGTIPAGLFDSIDTSSATDVSYLYDNTFSYYAANSQSGTIPVKLFNALDFSSANNVDNLFQSTFRGFAAANVTTTTDINAIWGNANFAGKITVSNIAYNQAGFIRGIFARTFENVTSLSGSAQTFINNMLGGINPTVRAYTFAGTSVNDLSTINPFWQ